MVGRRLLCMITGSSSRQELDWRKGEGWHLVEMMMVKGRHARRREARKV